MAYKRLAGFPPVRNAGNIMVSLVEHYIDGVPGDSFMSWEPINAALLAAPSVLCCRS